MRFDFELSGHGTVYLFQPLTPAARAWVEEHLPPDATWFGGAVVVEHRYIGPDCRRRDRRWARGAVMGRYTKRPRGPSR